MNLVSHRPDAVWRKVLVDVAPYVDVERQVTARARQHVERLITLTERDGIATYGARSRDMLPRQLPEIAPPHQFLHLLV